MPARTLNDFAAGFFMERATPRRKWSSGIRINVRERIKTIKVEDVGDKKEVNQWYSGEGIGSPVLPHRAV
jgi:hypothetical protein